MQNLAQCLEKQEKFEEADALSTMIVNKARRYMQHPFRCCSLSVARAFC